MARIAVLICMPYIDRCMYAQIFCTGTSISETHFLNVCVMSSIVIELEFLNLQIYDVWNAALRDTQPHMIIQIAVYFLFMARFQEIERLNQIKKYLVEGAQSF